MTMTMTVTAAAAMECALAVASAAGCAHRGAGPADTLGAFGAAIERKDYDAAYALTSDGFRKRVPLAAFRAELEAGGEDAQAMGKRLRDGAAREPLRVEVDVDLGEKVP